MSAFPTGVSRRAYPSSAQTIPSRDNELVNVTAQAQSYPGPDPYGQQAQYGAYAQPAPGAGGALAAPGSQGITAGLNGTQRLMGIGLMAAVGVLIAMGVLGLVLTHIQAVVTALSIICLVTATGILVVAGLWYAANQPDPAADGQPAAQGA